MKNKISLDLETKIRVAKFLGLENGKEMSCGGNRNQSVWFSPLQKIVETKDWIMAENDTAGDSLHLGKTRKLRPVWGQTSNFHILNSFNNCGGFVCFVSNLVKKNSEFGVPCLMVVHDRSSIWLC